ncbi:MAG: NUDIX hydrolase [Lewinella sp.]|jgi:ADP-ribose pyrophosphatase YjhB (NUDIX family)|uniref:NUDIX hydrolase n=1 Tax=Lewinella sp. TaxID=2004506 RepID=UPI003D6A7787
MYKIYINDRPLTLCDPLEMAQEGTPRDGHLVARYPGKTKFILNYVDLLEKGSPQVNEVTLFHTDLEELWQAFCDHYKIVEAAGGLVYNFAQQWLLIYRRGSWDLPKGKIDPGENPEQAAIREVQEETGLRELTLGEKLPMTYHTYRGKKDQRILKPTHWYVMNTPETQLTPQTEEDIEKAVWMSEKQFFSEERVVYPNISSILKTAPKIQ